MTFPAPAGRPLAIAHRAGNRLPRLEQAIAIGADLAEFDVWLYRGRLEVRHAKTVGPFPLLREGWRFSPARRPCLGLEDVIETAGREVALMVDLKSETPALSEAVAAAFERLLPNVPYAVTTREWRLLDPFEGRDHVRLIPSAAWPHELGALLPALGERYHALSLHASQAAPALLRELAARGVAVYVWPVNSEVDLARVVEAGAAGVNSDNLDLLAALIDGAEPAPSDAKAT